MVVGRQRSIEILCLSHNHPMLFPDCGLRIMNKATPARYLANALYQGRKKKERLPNKIPLFVPSSSNGIKLPSMEADVNKRFLAQIEVDEREQPVLCNFQGRSPAEPLHLDTSAIWDRDIINYSVQLLLCC